jgi:glutathione synthase/RimK-type ligase-like ATP-grasp enzyme
MSILIVSESGDVHANIVQHTLREHGIATTRLAADRLPQEQTLSYLFNSSDETAQINASPASDIQTVWLRRRGQPGNFEADRDAIDDRISRQEVGEFWKFCQFALPPSARHINPILSKLQAQSKIFQLRTAQGVGLRIPRTIISNDPGEVLEFTNSLGTVAFKSFSPVHWNAPGHGADAVTALFTTKISSRQVREHAPSIRRAPGIFQELITAVREYRVTLFGSSCIVAAIESTHGHASLSDWRAGSQASLKVSPASLPESLIARLRLFMERAELAFGAFDILETADHEFYFLEGNEAGQFLWIEHQNPDILMLKPFCDYLVGHANWSGPITLAQAAAGAMTPVPVAA